MTQEGEKSSKVVHLRVSHREAGRCANTCRVQTSFILLQINAVMVMQEYVSQSITVQVLG